MNNKFKVICLQIFLILFLFFVFFVTNNVTRNILAIFLIIYFFIIKILLKKRISLSFYKKQVNILMVIFGMIYLVVFYLFGLYTGFVEAKIKLSLWSIYTFIIPISSIIITSELIRNIFLSQNIYLNILSKKFNISKILSYISMVFLDLIIYSDIYNLNSLDSILTIVGFVLFASFSCNILYNYVSYNFGIIGIIIYRLLTILYIYIIPVIPDLYLFLRSFFRMIYPYIIYFILVNTYSKNKYIVSKNTVRRSTFTNIILVTTVIMVIMLVSCEFKFGILVVGSQSMTGNINMGDGVIFEEYDKQDINIGDVIVFNYNDIKTIHRVIDIKKINGEYRYFTKGDANKNRDNNYRTNKDIYGIVIYRIKYIGIPTLLFRKVFL